MYGQLSFGLQATANGSLSILRNGTDDTDLPLAPR